MDKLGVGYDVLKEVNPRIIYAAVSGFGCYGPYYKRPGYDIIAQATGGLMSITGEMGGNPLRVGNAMGDVLGGTNLIIGILLALHARTLSGMGQRVDVSLVDSVVASLETGTQRYFASGKVPELIGNRYAAACPYDAFGQVTGGSLSVAAMTSSLPCSAPRYSTVPNCSKMSALPQIRPAVITTRHSNPLLRSGQNCIRLRNV